MILIILRRKGILVGSKTDPKAYAQPKGITMKPTKEEKDHALKVLVDSGSLQPLAPGSRGGAIPKLEPGPLEAQIRAVGSEVKPQQVDTDPLLRDYVANHPDNQVGSPGATGPPAGTVPDKVAGVVGVIESVPDVALRLDAVSSAEGIVAPPAVPKVAAGDIVLFRISEDDTAEVLRPILLNSVDHLHGGLISGNLFLDPDIDWSCAWPRENMFTQLTDANRILAVYEVQFGMEMGKWRLK